MAAFLGNELNDRFKAAKLDCYQATRRGGLNNLKLEAHDTIFFIMLQATSFV